MCCAIVDGRHRLQAMWQFATESKVDWAFEPIQVRYICQKNGSVAAPAEWMKSSNITNEKPVIINGDTQFIDVLKNIRNYTWAFYTEYGVNFDDAHSADIILDMTSLLVMVALRESAYAW